MPKRIPGLAETILEKAAQLFSKLGYAAVDMKMVALEAGTSVGNLYNYHPSKPKLFLAVKNRWREDILEVCQEILRSEADRRTKSITILRRLYDDVARFQGLWAEFLGGSEERADFIEAKVKKAQAEWEEDESAVLRDIDTLLAGQKSADGVPRWALLAIASTLQLAIRFPKQREQNWVFIETLVDKI